MATYQFKGAGYGLPAVGGHALPLQRKIDVPQLIKDGANAGLALVGAPDVGVALPGNGFAAGDILEVFWVPKGTKVRGCGIYVKTAEGAVCTIDIGVQSATQTEDGQDVDGWGAAMDLNTAGATDATADADGFGSDTVPGGELYITNGSIDIEFNNDTDAAIFVVWADIDWLNIE